MLTFSRNIIFCSRPDKMVKVFNISSLLEGYTRLNHLTPPRMINGYYADPNDIDAFYSLYKIYLLQDPAAFMEMMDIAYALYEGDDVILLTGAPDVFRSCFEGSLMKFFLERYGYVSNVVLDQEDLNSLVEGTFSIFGLSNMDSDKEIYTKIQAGEYMPNIGMGLDDYD